MDDQYYYLPITSISPFAAKAIHNFAEELVSHGLNARIIFDAVSADPECALGHAYAAALFLTQMTREGQAQAAPHLIAAQQLSGMCCAREAATIEAIAAWSRNDQRCAITILRGIVECEPHDLVAAKLCQILEIGIGDVEGMLRTSAMAAAVDRRSGFALGLHAYALEQADHPELALRYARRAIDLNPERDPWAQHALAHALVAMDQPVEARAFLHSVTHSWDRCSSFMQTHNWWHLALLELELGDCQSALALFDERVWGVRKGHAQDQINAVSLLAQLEMHGVRPAWRWNDIASHVEHRITDRISDFLDLHYLIALTRSGRDKAAAHLAGALQANVLAGALANGIVAHAHGDYGDAAFQLASASHNLCEIGGSNIQRGLFEAIFRDSVTRSCGEAAHVEQADYRVAA